jgi:hypothetical protein
MESHWFDRATRTIFACALITISLPAFPQSPMFGDAASSPLPPGWIVRAVELPSLNRTRFGINAILAKEPDRSFMRYRPDAPWEGRGGIEFSESARPPEIRSRVGLVYHSGAWTIGVDHRQSHMTRGEMQKSARIFIGAQRQYSGSLSFYGGYARTPVLGVLWKPDKDDELTLTLSGRPSKELRSFFNLEHDSEAIFALVYRRRF